jgi:hypothetical protein
VSQAVIFDSDQGTVPEGVGLQLGRFVSYYATQPSRYGKEDFGSQGREEVQSTGKRETHLMGDAVLWSCRFRQSAHRPGFRKDDASWALLPHCA